MSLWSTRSGRVLAVAVAALLVATLAGMAALWPSGDAPAGPAGQVRSTSATVDAVRTPDCGGPQAQRCVAVDVRVDDGPRTTITLGPVGLAPEVGEGDRLRVTEVGIPEGASPDAEPYAFAGFDRRTPVLVLLGVVALAAVLLVTWRGVLALVGLGLSLLLITEFLLPAILDGRSAIAVALVGAMAVTFVTVVLTSGVGAQSLAALAGIALTLLLAAGAGVVVADALHLDGRTSELSQALATQRRGLSLEGVVLAGVVLGALGALTDTAVTQASAVMALRRADPSMPARRLYREAFTVGRDHLSATIHTLALAYAGATLPLLLALQSTATPLADALGSQDLAEPVAATLVGAFALLLCVPVATGLAVLLAVRVPADVLPDGHAHAH